MMCEAIRQDSSSYNDHNRLQIKTLYKGLEFQNEESEK